MPVNRRGFIEAVRDTKLDLVAFAESQEGRRQRSIHRNHVADSISEWELYMLNGEFNDFCSAGSGGRGRHSGGLPLRTMSGMRRLRPSGSIASKCGQKCHRAGRA